MDHEEIDDDIEDNEVWSRTAVLKRSYESSTKVLRNTLSRGKRPKLKLLKTKKRKPDR